MARGEGSSAAGLRPASHMRRRLALAFACLTALALLVIRGDGSVSGISTLRLVLASPAREERAPMLNTSSLYAKGDPWRAYLADDAVCPGGDRTDLPVARQAETVVCLVNFARRRRGLQPLSVRDVLNGASRAKASMILQCQRFVHNPCGGEWTSTARALGYAGQLGENLYLASGAWGAPRVAVDAWLNSPPHRENIFSEKWHEQGVAVVERERFGAYRDVAIWVNMLGDG
jgi:uncharacterized protein YkwD